MKVQYVLMLLLLMTVASCSKGNNKKNDGDNNGDTTYPRKGFGTSEEMPEGEQFKLPAGVSLIGEIKGYNEALKEFCDHKTMKDARGSGLGVPLCIGLRNTTTQIIHVSFPSGMIFISQEHKTQHGILVQGETVELPPGLDFYVPIMLCCMNSSLVSAGPDDKYVFGPVSSDKEIRKLCALLENKKLDANGPIGQKLEQIIWHLSDEPLRDEDRAFVLSLPNK
ncbi:hypothetical protein HHL16_09345 [Pseudoflavitalea sp. G-6-1-2]|uniref:hypothetical protein n=1 Tax=Pseudoflavitalea sp. G-6-1-2 TaxID=2728841 RepID=UPI00146C4CC1|nr:hypothetical protein [Pseudoflavitalea sp. G-6-1-2]NML21077.1 hypothetical protein [Pseudoflavitalea sp. G-6-1-2]